MRPASKTEPSGAMDRHRVTWGDWFLLAIALGGVLHAAGLVVAALRRGDDKLAMTIVTMMVGGLVFGVVGVVDHFQGQERVMGSRKRLPFLAIRFVGVAVFCVLVLILIRSGLGLALPAASGFMLGVMVTYIVRVRVGSGPS